MKVIAGIAVAAVLGLAGTTLGIIAVAGGGGGGFEEMTLGLTGSNEERVEFPAPLAEAGHPEGTIGWSSHSDVSGDRTGEYVRTCVPVVSDDIECNGAFLLEDGQIEIENTEEGSRTNTSATAAIVGGTDAYEGALGEFQVNWETDTYTLHLLIPEQ